MYVVRAMHVEWDFGRRVTIWALRDSRYWLRGGSDMDVAEPRGEIFFSGVCVGRYFIGNMVAMETLAPTRHAAKTA